MGGGATSSSGIYACRYSGVAQAGSLEILINHALPLRQVQSDGVWSVQAVTLHIHPPEGQRRVGKKLHCPSHSLVYHPLSAYFSQGLTRAEKLGICSARYHTFVTMDKSPARKSETPQPTNQPTFSRPVILVWLRIDA